MQVKQELLVETKLLQRGARAFRALKHPLRIKMLQLLHKKGRMMVTDLYKKMRIEQSVASLHLAVLRREGIVKAERQGRIIYYSVNHCRIKELEAFAGQLGEIEGHPVMNQAV